MPRTVKDITGKRFGKLVVAGFAGYGQTGRQRISLWKCRCDCGNTCIAQGYLLKSGRRKSCGCIRSTPDQMIGKRFGKLTVIAEDLDNHTTLQKVICRCDCGREKSIATRDLKSGKSSPLKNITSGYHYHTVEADSEETLDMIGEMLEEKGFLVEEKKERA